METSYRRRLYLYARLTLYKITKGKRVEYVFTEKKKMDC